MKQHRPVSGRYWAGKPADRPDSEGSHHGTEEGQRRGKEVNPAGPGQLHLARGQIDRVGGNHAGDEQAHAEEGKTDHRYRMPTLENKDGQSRDRQPNHHHPKARPTHRAKEHVLRDRPLHRREPPANNVKSSQADERDN